MAQRVGEFDFKAVTSSYTPSLDVHFPFNTPLGLPEQLLYLYGGWREADGTLHVFERKFIGPMTAGLWLMNARGGKVRIEPVSAQTVRGEVKRSFSGEEILLHGAMMEKVGDSGGAFSFRVTPGAFEWAEGDILALSGTLVGPGAQIYAADRTEPILYISELYKTTGTVLGDEVEGFVFYDHVYYPAGYDWKEYRVFKDLQLGWEAFANEYDDGSVEWGHLCIGRQGFNFTAISNNDGAVSMESGSLGGVDISGDDDWVTRAAWRDGEGRTWTFELEDGGQLSEFAAARGGGYRAQAGHTRRVGETRNVRLGFSWLETFADRIREDKVPSVDELLGG